ncbi:response regulator transcription factor [Paenibacillus sp. OAS669]|uniref:response regulator transcription factor n=1 Tax=Paenibacillus sp. OAS669 TaxID=2663821 RepID=UPI00178BF82C|nr:helix-turn-helix domain-containing protein [Paenibacillus sp. OAS669]MBE1440971.1 two-component system response regulator YesN [Paenibacillus sp. OAS669]
MYRLLIAEDVRTVREMLVRSVPWHALGIELLGAAEDGEEALDRLVREEADLLLTDIGMPGMNGLELIESAKALKPELACIILSGLNEFDHARQAIKLQVLDYILKPIDMDELERVVSSAVESLHKEREERRTLAFAEQAAKDHLPHLSEALPPAEWAGSVKKKKLAERALRYMKEADLRQELALSDVAAAVGLSDKYLNQLFKEVTGTTIHHSMIRLRMEEAARLLKDPSVKIYEICERIGYSDQDHFRESFKKQFGLTPTDYRNRYL